VFCCLCDSIYKNDTTKHTHTHTNRPLLDTAVLKRRRSLPLHTHTPSTPETHTHTLTSLITVLRLADGVVVHDTRRVIITAQTSNIRRFSSPVYLYTHKYILCTYIYIIVLVRTICREPRITPRTQAEGRQVRVLHAKRAAV